jgi:6-pyruvoyltetrahydropterin/6-carboxytetrahydropterin synthase
VTCEVGLSRSVRAFHIMPGMPGPEGQLHDHDYRIEIVVDREQLDERGMVCDLDVLEAALTELTSRVDGRNLEEIRPAEAEAVTVEVFARCGRRRSRLADTAPGWLTEPVSQGRWLVSLTQWTAANSRPCHWILLMQAEPRYSRYMVSSGTPRARHSRIFIGLM